MQAKRWDVKSLNPIGDYELIRVFKTEKKACKFWKKIKLNFSIYSDTYTVDACDLNPDIRVFNLIHENDI